MKRVLLLIVTIAALTMPTGCGGSRDKDVNKGKERPMPTKK